MQLCRNYFSQGFTSAGSKPAFWPSDLKVEDSQCCKFRILTGSEGEISKNYLDQDRCAALGQLSAFGEETFHTLRNRLYLLSFFFYCVLHDLAIIVSSDLLHKIIGGSFTRQKWEIVEEKNILSSEIIINVPFQYFCCHKWS